MVIAALTVFPVQAAQEVSMKRIYPPNLLKNGDFSRKTPDGMPEHWVFDNCSKADFKFRSDIGGIVIESPGKAYGYFLQTVPVQEGVRYCAAAKIRVHRTNANVWLSCPEYDDGGSALGHWPASQTKFFILAYPYQGRSAKALLDKFLDPDLVAGADDREWTLYTREFTPPVGKGIRTCAVRVGAYGGYRGWVNYTDVSLAPSESELKISLGSGQWKSLKVVDRSGAVCFSKENGEGVGNAFSVKLPSRTTAYRLILTGADGKVQTLEVPDEK